MGYLFKNCNIISFDNKKEKIIKEDVLVEDIYIEKVGFNIPCKKHNIINGQNKLLMPGFINTHTHSPMSILRGYADDCFFNEWLNDKILPFEKKMTKKDVKYSSLLAIAEMLLSGTTTFIDMYFNTSKISENVLKTGIRAVLSRGLVFNNKKSIDDKNIKETIELIEKYNNKDKNRIKIFMGPHSIYTNTKDFLLKQIYIARKYKIGINIHIAETKKEAEITKEKTGLTQIEYLEKIGFFDEINNLILAHCVYISEKDIKILKKYNVSISYNPKSNMKLGVGIAPIYKYIKNKINVCIGTDGNASNNNLDMLEELQYASLCQKGFFLNPKLMPAFDVLKMATYNGAKAIGLKNKLGKIKEGYEADLILFDLNNTNYYPKQNSLINHIVYSGNSRDIIMTMVQGKILMKNRRLLTINLKKIYSYFDKK